MRACAIGRESAQQSNSFYDVHLGHCLPGKACLVNNIFPGNIRVWEENYGEVYWGSCGHILCWSSEGEARLILISLCWWESVWSWTVYTSEVDVFFLVNELISLPHLTSIACVHLLPIWRWHLLSVVGKAGERYCRWGRGNEEGEADQQGSNNHSA